MKCLSVAQPYADLIVSGQKSIELRTWNTHFRGEFLIHAPLKIRRDDAKRLKMNKEFVTGAIIGKAELYKVKRYESLKELRADKKFHFASKKAQDHTFGFMLKNAKALNIPIPYKGQIGFFEPKLERFKIKEEEMISEIIDEEYRYQWIGHH